MATDLLLNNISAVTTAGGTTTPASGTVEVWAVVSSSGFTGVTTGAGTECRIVDTVAPTEIILLTNVAALAWTVTRGAEGTTPIAHAVGHTFVPVITAGALNSWAAGNFASIVSAVFAGSGLSFKIWNQASDPGGAAGEGDVWVDG